MASTRSGCRLGYVDETTWKQEEPRMYHTGHIPYVSLWSQRTQCWQLYAEHLLQTACIEQRDKRKAGCGQNVQGKLRKRDTSVNRVSCRFVIALRTLQVNTCKTIYLNCEERYKDMVDDSSYIHNFKSCEIKA